MSKEAKVPTVWVHPKAYYTMSYWAKLAGDKRREMLCFARCILEDGDAVVTDVYMVKHEGSSGAVDADDDDVVRLMMELNAKGVPPDEAFRCWVHSHPGTGSSATYLSGTDEEMIERFMSGDFLVSIVWDSAGGNPFCRIDYKNPRVSIVADLELYVPYLTAEELKDAKEEYEDKSRATVPSFKTVSTRKPGSKTTTTRKPPYTGYGSTTLAYDAYDDDDDDDDQYGYVDQRTGSYTTARYRSSQSLLDLEDYGLADDIDGMSDEDLRAQMADVLELEDEDLQQQWVEWMKEDPQAFHEIVELAKQEAREAAAFEYEITDERGNEIVMIDLVDHDEDDEVDSAAGVAVDSDSDEPEEEVSQDARNMNQHLRDNQDIDNIAMSVADGAITKEEGLLLTTARHELSEDEATAALEWRIG